MLNGGISIRMIKQTIKMICEFFTLLIKCLLGKEFYDSYKQEILFGIKNNNGNYGVNIAMLHSCFTKNQITKFEKRLFQITTWLLVLAFFPLFVSLFTLVYPLMLYIFFYMFWFYLYLLPFTLRIQRLFFIFAVWLFAFWFGVFSFYLSIIPSIFGFDEIIFDRRIFMGSELFYRFFDLPFDVLWFVFIALMIPLAILTLVSYRRISFALFFVLMATAAFWYLQEFGDKIYRHSYLSEYSYDYFGNKVKLGDIKGYQRKLKHLVSDKLDTTQRKNAINFIQSTEIYYYNKLYNKENKCVRDFFVKKTLGEYKPDSFFPTRVSFFPSIGMKYCDLVSNVPKLPLSTSKAVDAKKRQAENMIQKKSPTEFCTSYYDYVVKKAREECNK